ncbi:MAG: hypothetical protein NVV63_08870 [Opitutus sp.]|nr:hypothetical protein [Opitutus sp.]
MNLSHEQIRSALAAQPLFEDKTWQLSPSAWVLTPEQHAQLEAIGAACLEFHQALESLYLRAAAGKNLLRNKPLTAPWVVDYLDRGKPAALIEHARDPKNRGAFPTVLRPDLLLTDDGFALTELDSVPGGIGLTAFLNRLYRDGGQSGVIGADDAMVKNFHASLAALRPELPNPLIVIAVSDEAATYRPEMEWLAHQLQLLGKRVFCLKPEDIFPLGSQLCFDVEGNPEKIDIIYRFFELFDLANVRTAKFIFESWAAGEVAIAPPLRHFQEEKLALALFHHHLLQDYWQEALSSRALKLLRALIPQSWVMDPAPLPPGAVLDGPRIGGRALNNWRDLANASQKERDLIIKVSGYHETAWGARSVVLGSDCSRDEWQQGIERAIELAPENLHILQTYRKPKRAEHPLYVPASPESGDSGFASVTRAGRLRLCPYYFVIGGKAQLSGALATFCPPDKKIIHGMQDAALLPTRVG